MRHGRPPWRHWKGRTHARVSFDGVENSWCSPLFGYRISSHIRCRRRDAAAWPSRRGARFTYRPIAVRSRPFAPPQWGTGRSRGPSAVGFGGPTHSPIPTRVQAPSPPAPTARMHSHRRGQPERRFSVGFVPDAGRRHAPMAVTERQPFRTVGQARLALRSGRWLAAYARNRRRPRDRAVGRGPGG